MLATRHRSVHRCFTRFINTTSTFQTTVSVSDVHKKLSELERELTQLKKHNEQLQKHNKELRARANDTQEQSYSNSIGVSSLVRQIGVARTCFPKRFGTPRQASLVPSVRGKIVLDKTVINASSLKDLDQFSHVWLIFAFHENTNLDKTIRGSNAQLQNKRKSFPAHVKPPQAGGAKVGLFATRSPHRPSAIGLSLATIRKVDIENGIVEVRGMDLLDQTPILDIKPYVPYADCPDAHGKGLVRAPDWVTSFISCGTDSKRSLANVTISEGPKTYLKELVSSGTLEWFKFDEIDDCIQAITECIQLDPRALHHGRGSFVATPITKFHLMFDRLHIVFEPTETGEFIVSELDLVKDK